MCSVHFLVQIKWEGYNENWNTWEVIDNLNCQELIKPYAEVIVDFEKSITILSNKRSVANNGNVKSSKSNKNSKKNGKPEQKFESSATSSHNSSNV